jgi:hypothetical protein
MATTLKNMGITCKYLGNTLRPLTPTWRAKVRARYNGPTKLDDTARKALSEAIFSLEDEYEYSLSSNSRAIKTLRAIRNVLLDDLGENENLLNSRYPFIESVAAIIREKRRAGNPNPVCPWLDKLPSTEWMSDIDLSHEAP